MGYRMVSIDTLSLLRATGTSRSKRVANVSGEEPSIGEELVGTDSEAGTFDR